MTLPSCSPGNSAIPEPRHAREILEKALDFIAKDDYEAYISYKYKHPDIEPESKDSFEIYVSFWKESIGDYIFDSARFSEAEYEYGYIEVKYYATFTNKPTREVLVNLHLINIDGNLHFDGVGFVAKTS